MIEFNEACSEIDFILEHLRPEDKEKIPKSVFDFFRENKSLFYNVNISIDKPLKDQELKDETKAFLQIINYKYFADEKQKEKFEQILKDYDETKRQETIQETKEIVIYKENKLIKILKKICKFFNREIH